MNSLEKIVKEAAERYNKYRFPEASAKVLSVNEKSINILFEGPFAASCCFYDWIEDYAREVMELSGLKLKVESIEQIDSEKFKVKFKIES